MIACALIAIALIAYTYVGYPIVIGALARLFPARPRGAAAVDQPDARADAADHGGAAGRLPTVSICMPVFNGAAYLPAKVESLLAQDYPSDRIEILIFCDGCSDGSERIARQLAASPGGGGRIRVLAAAERRGKPAALNLLGAEASGQLLLLNDVRQPFSANAVRALVGAVSGDDVGCATGNLVLAGGAPSGVYWRYENWIRRQESRFRGVIGMTGAIAMLRKSDLMPLPEDLILDDVWIPTSLGLTGKRVVLVTAAHAYDTAFEDQHEFRRKVRTLAGNYQLFARRPALLLPFVNPFWFETVSHKVMRLVAPWLMLGLAVASVGAALSGTAGPLGGGLMRALVLAQGGFYAAAAVGGRGGRLTSVARTFVVLNAAAVVGLLRYLSGRQRVTW
jgi:cellulose synthase/poly-beta-1,6-N-acetylglucosamine synthase-like glycosyltransferase